MKEFNKRIYKISILNDLIGIELSKVNLKQITNPIAQSKLRNLKKSTDIFTAFVDESFKTPIIQESFGDLCDEINELVDEIINKIDK